MFSSSFLRVVLSVVVLFACSCHNNNSDFPNPKIECTDWAYASAAGGVLPSATTNPVGLGELYAEPSTFHSLGFEWKIAEEKDKTARILTFYRKKGELAWRAGMDLAHLLQEKAGMDDWLTENMYAGSILLLDPATEYEVVLRYVSDKAMFDQCIQTSTKSPPVLPSGDILQLFPVDTSMDGIPENVDCSVALYRQRAEANFDKVYQKAKPGDHIAFHGGNYRCLHVTLTKAATRDKPIVLRPFGDGDVILTYPTPTNQPANYAIQFDKGASYHYIDGLTIKNYYYGVYSEYPITGATVTNCMFEKYKVAILFESRSNRDILISDNYLTANWPARAWQHYPLPASPFQNDFPLAGISISGQGIDVSYNEIIGGMDGFSTSTAHRAGLDSTSPSLNPVEKVSAIDFYNNYVHQIYDDNQADYGQHNIRVFANVIIDAHIALSAQPIYGGPAYFFRNIQYNITRGHPLKVEQKPVGMYYLNNTFIGSFAHNSDGTISNGGAANFGNQPADIHVLNNLFLGLDRPADWTRTGVAYFTLWAGVRDLSSSTWDYNGYRKLQCEASPCTISFARTLVGMPTPTLVSSFADMAATFGFENHRSTVDFAIFEDVPPPVGESVTYNAADLTHFDYRLKTGGAAIDQGVFIPNINDDVIGTAPDLGAVELSRPRPCVGPRRILSERPACDP